MGDMNRSSWIKIHYASPAFVPDYMPWAILELISLCFPLGTLAMILCIAADFAKVKGNVRRARRYAAAALWLLAVGFVLGLTIKIVLTVSPRL